MGFSAILRATVAKDYYAILGLERSASADDVKKAYRRLSKELHPDKHKGDRGVEEKFKEVNEAYEVLSNPQKRQMYDQFGSADGSAGFGGPGGFDFGGFNVNFNGQQNVDFGDLFESFFGGQRAQARSDRGADREVQVRITFAQAVTGATRSFSVRRLARCASCDGGGAEKGSEIVSCEECAGTGQITRDARSFFGVIQQRVLCPRCKGAGKVPQRPCAVCSGEGRVATTEQVEVQIPAGINDGQTLRVTGGGDAGRLREAAGDLYVVVSVDADPAFQRDGDDIRTELHVHVLDAILGADVTVSTVHGPVTLSVPEGTQPGQVLRIRGKGMPVLGTHRTGDHYVTVQVDIPAKLSRAERKILQEWQEARA